MGKIRLAFTIAAALVYCSTAAAQAIDTAARLNKIFAELKGLKNVSYDYTRKGEFPNGDKDELKGKVFISRDDQSLLDDCDGYTMLYNGKWMYNANHRQKTLAIMDMQKGANKKMKQEVEKQVFGGASLDAFTDSLILKKATIKKFASDGKGAEKLSLAFPAGNIIKSIYIEYDRNTATVLRYEMVVFQPVQKTAEGIKGLTTRIACTNFSKTIDKAVFRDDAFFTYAKGKLSLKKYTTYKLTTKI